MQGLFSLKKKRYSTETTGRNFFLSKANSKGSQHMGSSRGEHRKQLSLGDKHSILQRFHHGSGSGTGKISSSSVMNRRFPSIDSESRAVSKLNSSEKFKQMSGFSFSKANSGETNRFSFANNIESEMEPPKVALQKPGLFNSCLWKKQSSGVQRSSRRTHELRTLNSKLRSESRQNNSSKRRSNDSNHLPQLSKEVKKSVVRRGESKENHRASKEHKLLGKGKLDKNRFKTPPLSMRLNSLNHGDVQQLCRAVFSHAFRQVDSIYSVFRNLQEVGSGSYAVAYLAEKKKTREKFVLKTFELRKFTKKSHLNRFMVRFGCWMIG